MGRGVRLLLAFAGLTAVVFLTTALAFGSEGPESPTFRGSFGPDGPGTSNFDSAGSVAVDQQSEAVYVLDPPQEAVYKFDREGNPLPFTGSSPDITGNKLSGMTSFTFATGSQVAVDAQTHRFYVTAEHSLRAFEADGEPAEFTSGAGAGTAEIPGFTELYGVAVDNDGNIYAADQAGTVSIFAPSGELLTEFAAPQAANLAVAPDGSVYVARFHGTVLKYSPSESPVTTATTYTAAPNEVDPNETRTVAVSPVTGDVYLVQHTGSHHHVVVYDENGQFIETFAEPGEEGELFNEATGIAVHGIARVYVSTDDASSGGEISQVRIFAPLEPEPGSPTVSGIHVSNVGAGSAQLHAQINPNTYVTTYQFEYGLEDCSIAACTAVPSGGEGIGAGYKPVAVDQSLTGLAAGTTYHYRVVAENQEGTAVSNDKVFTTQAAGTGFALSDSRAWELVSPADKHGGTMAGSREGLIEAAADGDGLTYVSLGSITGDPSGSRAFEPSTLLAHRGTAGWITQDITPPNDRVFSVAEGLMNPYKMFTADLGRALVEPRSSTVFSPEATERTPYLRANTEPPVYTPLVTGAEGFANVPPGTIFGDNGLHSKLKVQIAGATGNLEQIALKSEVPLVEGAPEEGDNSLYEWTAGHLRPISVLPAAEGGAIVKAELLGSGPGSVQHAISSDGSRVVWSLGFYGSVSHITGLYMRDTATQESVRLDVPQSGATGSGDAFPVFQAASPDGTVVFFTDPQQLTEDAGSKGRDLYRCEIPAGNIAGGCATLTDVSAPLEGSGESGNVKPLVAAVSDDAKTVYFVAQGILDPAPNGMGDEAEPGKPNLYRWQEGKGTRFIATLSVKDEADWGGSQGITAARSAAGSPSGRYLAFMSERSLTGYDNHDVVSGEPVEEVYRFDDEADSLTCVSCNPSGASPRGAVASDRRFSDPQGIWNKRWIAASLPEATVSEVNGSSLYQPRMVLDNGRVFFNAIESLVPGDANGQVDVYQFEPTGVGSCTPSTEGLATMRSSGGCVGLISSGSGEEEAAFLDASTSGDDVFFLSPARLSVLDKDTIYDVYDARVNGVPATLNPRSECSGEGCQQAAEDPRAGVPNSATFNGSGNGKARCPAGKRRARSHGRTRCVRPKHHKHRHQHRRKHSHNRGGGR